MKSFSVGAVVVAATVCVLLAGSVVADRLGAPAELVTMLTLLLAVAGLILAGLSARTMKPSSFYTAGRTLSSAAVLALTVTLALSAGAVGAKPGGVLDLDKLSTACAGLLAYAVLAAGPLRRAGGYTFADAVAARFGSRLLTGLAGLAALAVLAGLALWLAPAAVEAVRTASGLAPGPARIAVLALCAAIVFPGGLGGVAAAALLVAALIVGAFLAPLLPALTADLPTRSQWLAQTWQTFEAASRPGPGWPLAALAAAGALTLLNPSGGGAERHAPFRTSALAVIVVATVAFLGVFANEVARQRQTAIESATAQSVPPMIFSDRFRGLVRICGSEPTTPDDLTRICARAGYSGRLPPEAIRIEARGGRWHAAILGIPSAAGEALGLAAPLLLLLGLSFACHAAAAALSRDLLRRFILPPATAGGDLALQRLATLAVLGSVLFAPASLPSPDPRLVSTLLFVAASVPLPLVILARWPRADWRAALCGVASAIMAGVALWFGYLDGPAGALAGVLSALAAGLIAALLFPAATDQSGLVAVLEDRASGPLVLDRSA